MYNILAHRYAVLMQNTTLEAGCRTVGKCIKAKHIDLTLRPKLKFIHSEKATKFCEMFTLLLSYLVPVKRKVKNSPNFVAFSEYMNFTRGCHFITLFRPVHYRG